MKRSLLIFVFNFILILASTAQNYYWIGFTDKNNTSYSLSNPQAYLSDKALERRTKQNIAIDSLDLPVNQSYIDSVLTLGISLVHTSKWLNGMTVKADSTDLADRLSAWSFVKYVQLSKPDQSTKSAHNKFENEMPIDTAVYEASVYQVGMLNGQFLHEKNFRGDGMLIAVIDAGFYKANDLPAFDSLWADNRILGTRDFVEPGSDIWTTNYHGMSVLSCMGGNVPGQLIGTAPDASYWLLRSEDNASEFIVEEDNWAVAAEFADSVGVDVINSSLGYYTFDDPLTDHSYADMDGKTTRVTQAANIAASRGMLVFTSAGNERDNSWQRIIAPSDGELVIGVGAVDKDLNPAYFTSAGPAASGAVKPNVSAMGYRTIAQFSSGTIGQVSGTSFSSPVMAGIGASLWQMFPEKTAVEIKEAIEMSASQYNSPDSLVGYGIPDMKIAAELLGYQNTETISTSSNWKIYPNPVKNQISILPCSASAEDLQIDLYSLQGRLLKSWAKNAASKISISDLPDLTTGMYVLRIKGKSTSESFKLNVIE